MCGGMLRKVQTHHNGSLHLETFPHMTQKQENESNACVLQFRMCVNLDCTMNGSFEEITILLFDGTTGRTRRNLTSTHDAEQNY